MSCFRYSIVAAIRLVPNPCVDNLYLNKRSEKGTYNLCRLETRLYSNEGALH